MKSLPKIIDFTSLRDTYAAGLSLHDMIDALAERIEAADPAVFIRAATREQLREAADDLIRRAPQVNGLPLWGLPVAVKDNIDVAGFATTAGCPEYAYEPMVDAHAVARLRAAGAIIVGKTNLDQFATGLNGTRSPYGAPRCVFDEAYVSGGSSSGSGVAVAAGLAAFALGTDTAGSGRVPAAFNNIVGFKPSPGRVSTTGVVPACRSIDVVTVFAACVADAVAVRHVMEGFDPADAFARRYGSAPLPPRLRLGVPAPEEREFFGNAPYAALYEEAIERAASLGAQIVTFDYRPFREAAALLYEGPFVAERLAAIKPFIDACPERVEPTVRRIIEGARGMSAVEAFEGIYRLAGFRREAEGEWAKVDALLLPTSPDIQTVEAMLADPLALNARFGRFTNFANFFGCAAIAVPSGFTASGLPFGVQLVSPRDTDDALASFAAAMHEAAGAGAGRERAYRPPATLPAPIAEGERIEIVVVGAHLSGMPLNAELVEAGGRLARAARTAPHYRLYALSGTTPPKPGLAREPGFAGPGLEVEVWTLPVEGFGRFVASIPAPLGIGKVRLHDDALVCGFLCEGAALADARDITAHGGWRNYIASLAPVA